MDRTLSLVIITKDTKELLESLLDSIGKDLSLKPCIDKIIIVDNASTDGTDSVIMGEYPSVFYVRNEENRGFAAAVNKGSSLTESKYVLFLNSDTILLEDELVKMLHFMEQNTDVAICGPQLVYPDMKKQRSFAAIPSLAREIFPLSSPTSHLPPPTSVFADVDSLIGAAILVRREVLEMLNGFDERYFFFLEETDFCVRVRQAGQRVVFLPEAKIIHLQGKTVRKNWIRGRMEYNISLAKFIQKHHTQAYYAIFMAVKLTKALLFVILFPLPLFGKRMRMKYTYYIMLISWYFHGCPDNAGLRSGKDA